MTTTMSEAEAAAAEAVTERLFGEGVGAMHLLCVHLGVELGLYRHLAEAGPLTAAELAARAGVDAWYVREWLQAERAAGLVTAEGDDVDSGRVSLADGVAAALVDEVSPFNIAGVAGALAAVGRVTPLLLDAFRTGGGVPYEAYGPGAVSAQAALNRPAYANSLVAEWLPAVPELLARLEDTTNPARVADVGCGVGWSSIELAKAFPHLTITGLDSDETSIARARKNAAGAGVSDRVDFEVHDITRPYPAGTTYDVIAFFECLHDLAHPVEALTAARSALSADGFLLVMDENVSESPSPAGDPIETFFAAASVLWCLPQGRVDADSTAVGTVMRPSTLEGLATRAGFAGVRMLPIDHPFFRFYRLVA